jgi:hypothetical protein
MSYNDKRLREFEEWYAKLPTQTVTLQFDPHYHRLWLAWDGKVMDVNSATWERLREVMKTTARNHYLAEKARDRLNSASFAARTRKAKSTPSEGINLKDLGL